MNMVIIWKWHCLIYPSQDLSFVSICENQAASGIARLFKMREQQKGGGGGANHHPKWQLSIDPCTVYHFIWEAQWGSWASDWGSSSLAPSAYTPASSYVYRVWFNLIWFSYLSATRISCDSCQIWALSHFVEICMVIITWFTFWWVLNFLSSICSSPSHTIDKNRYL